MYATFQLFFPEVFLCTAMTKELLGFSNVRKSLNSLAIPTIEPKLSSSLDYTDITDSFTLQ
jgi:hypothetical protein